jgi:hypothetical protein
MKTLATLCTLVLALATGCAAQADQTDVEITESELGSRLNVSPVVATNLFVAYDSWAPQSADKVFRRVSVRISAPAIATRGSSFASSETSVQVEATESDGLRILGTTKLLDSSSASANATSTGFIVHTGSTVLEVRGNKLTIRGLAIPPMFTLDPKAFASVTTDTLADEDLTLPYESVNQREVSGYSGTKKHVGLPELGLHCWRIRATGEDGCRVSLQGKIVGSVGGKLLIEKVLDGAEAQTIFNALPPSQGSIKRALGKDGAQLACGNVNGSARCIGRVFAQ